MNEPTDRLAAFLRGWDRMNQPDTIYTIVTLEGTFDLFASDLASLIADAREAQKAQPGEVERRRDIENRAADWMEMHLRFRHDEAHNGDIYRAGPYETCQFCADARDLIAELRAGAALEPEVAPDTEFVVCGIDGCEFAVERGEGRTMALHQSEDHTP